MNVASEAVEAVNLVEVSVQNLGLFFPRSQQERRVVQVYGPIIESQSQEPWSQEKR